MIHQRYQFSFYLSFKYALMIIIMMVVVGVLGVVGHFQMNFDNQRNWFENIQRVQLNLHNLCILNELPSVVWVAFELPQSSNLQLITFSPFVYGLCVRVPQFGKNAKAEEVKRSDSTVKVVVQKCAKYVAPVETQRPSCWYTCVFHQSNGSSDAQCHRGQLCAWVQYTMPHTCSQRSAKYDCCKAASVVWQEMQKL